MGKQRVQIDIISRSIKGKLKWTGDFGFPLRIKGKSKWTDDFGFPIVNFPWLSGDVPRLPSYGIYISQLVRFARCCTSVLDFHSKNLQITSKLLTQGYRYHKLRKNIWKILYIILWTSVEIWGYFVPRIFVKRNLSSGLLRWSSLQIKEGQRHTEFHLVGFENSQTPSTTTVWPSDHQEDYRSCAWPFYSLVRTFP